MQDRPVVNQHRNLGRLGSVVCEVPFTAFQIYEGGHVSNCCFTWLPKRLGNINEKSLYELYAGQAAAEIRQSVQDGSYRFCDVNVCPKLAEFLNTSNPPGHPLLPVQQAQDLSSDPVPPLGRTIRVYFNYDKSCNLQCPSCRSERLLYSRANAPASLLSTHENTIKSVEELLVKGYRVMVNLTGSGDPFASPLYWDYLKSLQPRLNLSLNLQTNGLLMDESRLLPAIRSTLDFVNISVDAATEETYLKVRKGGLFQKVKANVEMFDRLALAGEFPRLSGWQLNFIVQADNFREMEAFAVWALQRETVTSIWFNLIADWGHLSEEEFRRRAVWMKSHPEHEEFLEAVQSPVLRQPRIHLGNLSGYLKDAK